MTGAQPNNRDRYFGSSRRNTDDYSLPTKETKEYPEIPQPMYSKILTPFLLTACSFIPTTATTLEKRLGIMLKDENAQVSRIFSGAERSPRFPSEYIGRRLPPYVFEDLWWVIAGSPASASSARLIGGGFLVLLYIVLAVLLFPRVYRYAVRSGLIARYSAESVNLAVFFRPHNKSPRCPRSLQHSFLQSKKERRTLCAFMSTRMPAPE